MILKFSDEEKEYLVKEPFNWHASDDAPENIKKSIAEKLNLLKKEDLKNESQ